MKRPDPGLLTDTSNARHRLAAPAARHARVSAAWAQSTDEVRQAQRLRHAVFAEEMGARLETPVAGHDIDRFDDYCEHLLVRDLATRQVVGTYRLLTPAQASRLGTTYCDDEFDLTPLQALRPRMAELGRSCVHADYRHGGVLLALWGALAEFMRRNQLDTMLGCASIPLLHGHGAAGVWQRLRETHLAAPPFRVLPRLPLPVDAMDDALYAEPPALIRGYLRLGARVLGPPAWDPHFNTADLPIMMRMADMPARYQRGPADG